MPTFDLPAEAVPRLSPRWHIEDIDGDVVAWTADVPHLVHLDPIGRVIVRLCDGTRDVGSIVELLVAAWPDDADAVRADAPALLRSLVDRGLCELG